MTNFINSILHTFDISYELRGHAGVESQPLTILNSSRALKGCNAEAVAAIRSGEIASRAVRVGFVSFAFQVPLTNDSADRICSGDRELAALACALP